MGGGPPFIFVYFFGHFFFPGVFNITHHLAPFIYLPLSYSFFIFVSSPFFGFGFFVYLLRDWTVFWFYFLCGMWDEGYGDEGSMLKKYYT